MGGHGQKWMRPFRSYETLNSGASHIWFSESTSLTNLFLHAESDSIIFGLTNLLRIFDISWVYMAVVPIKNDVLLLVATGKVLELGF